MTFDHPAMLLLLYVTAPMIVLMAVNYRNRFARIYSLIAPLSTVFYDDIGGNRRGRERKLTVQAELNLRYIVSFSCLSFFMFACALPLPGRVLA